MKTKIGSYIGIIIFLAILVLIWLFVKNQMETTEAVGVITVAKVTNYEGAESGSDLFIDIYYHDKIYKTRLGFGCGSNCVGNFFFIKIKTTEPTSYPIFYGDKAVPDCIIQNVKYYKGWQEFPTCTNY
jgi:hypothetical protein